MDETPKPKPPPGRKAAPRAKKPKPEPAEEKSDLQRHREFVASRLDAWVGAYSAMKERGLSPDPSEVLQLAEFLTGDHI